MGRILAIDYGTKRTGLAVTDPLRIVANGLDTVPTHELISFLEKYLAKETVDIIVFGLPKQMSGAESESMKHIRPVVKKIQEKFSEIELVYVDERFTSILAQKAMIEGGLKKKARQDKALVDKISATIILQSYLESLNPSF
ncbi:MAG TPA: Holliday junction resolvase RuvX [Bacteroidales bacterium]|nr:Holliday junction resolvase RuvX [Bacteroidales bacterium]